MDWTKREDRKKEKRGKRTEKDKNKSRGSRTNWQGEIKFEMKGQNLEKGISKIYDSD